MLFILENIEYKLQNKVILNNLSFSIKPGQHLLLHGPSGCGKTTLINLMSGLLRLSAGRILFENTDYSGLSDEKLDSLRADNFGFIFQKLHLINHLNVEQNILIAKNKQHFQDLDQLIKELNIFDKKKQMIRDLSVGEAQRVAIARGVINNPKVIFADEPTSSLDDLNAKKVMNLILSQTEKINSTLVMSSHDIRIKNFFSNVLEVSK